MKSPHPSPLLPTLLAVFMLFSLTAAAPRQLEQVTFALIGDYGIDSQAEADVARLVKSWSPALIVTLGDNNYPNGAAYSLESNIGKYYQEYLYKYKGKYGNGSETRRFFPALGNHDWHNGSVNPYLNYFNLPGNERYYDFTYGSVHFFILDSVENEPDGNTSNSAQAKWLREKMGASTLPFQVVATHYPPYSSGKHGSVPFMQWDFKAWGADVVLAGHNHIYERLQVGGLTYIVNGLGGDYIGSFRPEILPESQMRYNGDYGALRVEVSSAMLKFQFITRNNVLIDEYIINAAPAMPGNDSGVVSAVIVDESATAATPTPSGISAVIVGSETLPPPPPSAIPPSIVILTPTASADIPLLFTPADGLTLSAHFDFIWQTLPDATRYEIQIDNNADFSSPEWNSWRREAGYHVASMPRKTTYFWRARAKTNGNWGAWSSVFRFYVP